MRHWVRMVVVKVVLVCILKYNHFYYCYYYNPYPVLHNPNPYPKVWVSPTHGGIVPVPQWCMSLMDMGLTECMGYGNMFMHSRICN